MNIIEYVKSEASKKGLRDDPNEILEFLQECCEFVQEKRGSKHRWYIDVQIVVKHGKKYIQYDNELTTGDSDNDFQFNIESIIEVKPETETVTIFTKI